jgi:hypothetical protein
MMPRLLLQREPSVNEATLGKLYDRNVFVCDILEDEIREQHGVPVAEWKVHGKTAIPAGTYEVILEDSARFGPNTLTLRGVEGYKYIRIHAGNTSADTEGCLIVGERNSNCTVKNSRIALAALKDRLVIDILSGEVVLIQIENPGVVV